MIRDRGTKKWVAMMLPEHVKMVRSFFSETKKAPKPELDLQAIEEIELVIIEAQNTKKDVTLTFWEDGYFTTIIGQIHKINIPLKTISIKDKSDFIFYIEFTNVINVKLTDE